MHVCETNIDAHVKFKELTDKTCMYVHINVHSCSRSKTVACSIGMQFMPFNLPLSDDIPGKYRKAFDGNGKAYMYVLKTYTHAYNRTSMYKLRCTLTRCMFVCG